MLHGSLVFTTTVPPSRFRVAINDQPANTTKLGHVQVSAATKHFCATIYVMMR